MAFAYKNLRSYIALGRFDKPVGIWLLLLPGWWSIVMASGGFLNMTGREWWIFTLFGLGAVVMRTAGCVINDIWDRDLDSKVARTKNRPLAAGTISVSSAIVFLILLLTAGFLILIQMNILTIVLGLLTIPMIVTYPLMKRITWWPQAFLGITFNFGALMGWAAVTGEIGAAAILIYIAGIFWTLGYDTIYAHQDKDDDALARIKSTARYFGARSKLAVAGFYTISWIFVVGAALFVTQNSLYLLALLPAAGHLIWQIKQWNPDDANKSLEIFRSNIYYGIIVLFVFGFFV